MAYNERLKSLLKTLAAAAFWLLCWQGLSLLVKKPLLLPSPVETVQRLLTLVGRADFWQSIGMTLLRVTGGFLLGAVCGVLFGALSAKSKLIERLSAPLLAVVKATPVASFIILALVWIQKDGVPVFITFLIVLPVIWNNVLTGIRQTDRGRFSGRRKGVIVWITNCIPWTLPASRLRWNSDATASRQTVPYRH